MIDWDALAKDLGHDTGKDMLTKLYTELGSIQRVAMRLSVSTQAVRQQLERCEIPVRPPGGPNNVKVHLTPELRDQILQQGIDAVADQMGVDRSTLYKRLRASQPGIPETPSSQ